jgi:hypothetical protein
MFAMFKSKHRTKARMDRRNSLRSSMRSSRQSVMTARSLASLADTETTAGTQKRRRPQMNRSDNGFLDITGVTTTDVSIDDTIDKIKMQPPSTTPQSSFDMDQSIPSKYEPSYNDSDLREWKRPPRPRVENEIPNIMTRPMFDNVLRNQAFDEESLDRSRVGAYSPYPDQDYYRASPLPRSQPPYRESPGPYDGYRDSPVPHSDYRGSPRPHSPYGYTPRKVTRSVEHLDSEDGSSQYGRVTPNFGSPRKFSRSTSNLDVDIDIKPKPKESAM